ncbi:putative virion structural protein [Serratia phage vB_SmaM-Kodama]|nr:putative virion structural protein [Serratia phage vB_SmaM-Kodama]
MADTTQRLYVDGAMSLAQTMTIKFNAGAVAINNYLTEIGYTVDPNVPSTWRYYMNLAGKYHVSNQQMKVTSLDTLEEIDFTYDNLLIHRATKAAYKYGSRYYNELVEQYPEQELLIRGVLWPVDIDKAIDAKDFTILYYDSDEVDPNETYLIQDLQEWIYRFTYRWYLVFAAAVQKYYPATFFGTLFIHLVGEIISIRENYCRTQYVHSYHLWAYLGSHGRLNAYKDYVNITQALWLYRNIRYIDNHAGKTTTFDDLILNILTARNIPLTAYFLRHNSKDVPESILPEGEVAKDPKNYLAESVQGIERISIGEALDNEVNSAKDNDKYLAKQKIDVPIRVANAITGELPTKVLESVMIDRSDSVPHKFVDTLMGEWIYLATEGRYVANITIPNPATQEAMSMTVREALILWVYCAMRQFEMVLEDVPDLTAWFVQRLAAPEFSELRGVCEPKYVSESAILMALTEHTPVSTIISTEAFYNTVAQIQSNINAHRVMYTRQQDFRARGQMEVMTNRFYINKKCQLSATPIKYADWFHTKNWDMELSSPEAYSDFCFQLIEVATGANLRSTISVSDVHSAMIAIMTQLSSYSVQYVHKTNASPNIIVDNLAIRFGGIESRPSADFKIDQRVEIINQYQRGKLSPDKSAFEGIEIGSKYIHAPHFYRVFSSVDFLPDTHVATRHQIEIAEVRFKGSLAKDIGLEISKHDLDGLWLYLATARPINEVVTNPRLPGLWVRVPREDEYLPNEITKTDIEGLWTNVIPGPEKLVIGNKPLPGLWLEPIVPYELEDFKERLEGFDPPEPFKPTTLADGFDENLSGFVGYIEPEFDLFNIEEELPGFDSPDSEPKAPYDFSALFGE